MRSFHWTHRNTSRTSDHQGLFQGPNPTEGYPHSYPLISHFIICGVTNNLNRKLKNSDILTTNCGGGDPKHSTRCWDLQTIQVRPTPCTCQLSETTMYQSWQLLPAHCYGIKKQAQRSALFVVMDTDIFISVSMKLKLTNFNLKNLQVKFASPLWGCVYCQQRMDKDKKWTSAAFFLK